MKLREDDRKLLDALINKGHLDRSFEEILTQFIEKWETRVFDAILETRVVDEKKLADLISEGFGIERLEHLENYIVKNSEMPLPLRFLKEWTSYVLTKDNELCFAVANPVDDDFHEALRKTECKTLKIVIAEKSAILRALHENYLVSEIH